MKISNEEISIKAYELWEARGCPPDSAEYDWYTAEALLRAGTVESAGAEDGESIETQGQARYGLRAFR